MMDKISDYIGEGFVNHIWESGHFIKSNLRTKDGRKIEVLHPGQWNNDAGADFTNAIIKIDGKIIKGDVEVHVRNSDWSIHHHDKDSRYNNTILHIALLDGGTNLLSKKQNGEYIPNLILGDYLDGTISKLLKAMNEKDKHNQCPVNINPNIIDQAGVDRLKIKSNWMTEQLINKDKDQVLYEGIMDALGYSKNRKQFQDLAQKVPISLLIGQKPEKIQAMLFGTAGLLPDNKDKLDKETNEYLEIIFPIWDEIKHQFQDKLMSKEEWRFFRLRPDNFPTRRIAGISFILCNLEPKKDSLSERILSVFDKETESIKKLFIKLKAIIKPKVYGYWASHFDFGSKRYTQSDFIIGDNRTDDIIVNVIFPFAYFQMLDDEKSAEKVIKLWAKYGRLQDNTITRYFSNRLFQSEKEYLSIVNSALRQQGLIHIYKSFCSVNNCHNCPFI
ncbi:MAG: DUF2851 family protein [Candidatus Poribacteria bacterium]